MDEYHEKFTRNIETKFISTRHFLRQTENEETHEKNKQLVARRRRKPPFIRRRKRKNEAKKAKRIRKHTLKLVPPNVHKYTCICHQVAILSTRACIAMWNFFPEFHTFSFRFFLLLRFLVYGLCECCDIVRRPCKRRRKKERMNEHVLSLDTSNTWNDLFIVYCILFGCLAIAFAVDLCAYSAQVSGGKYHRTHAHQCAHGIWFFFSPSPFLLFGWWFAHYS